MTTRHHQHPAGFIPVRLGTYARLSPRAKRVLATLERWRDSGEEIWEINALEGSRLADCSVTAFHHALGELTCAKVIAMADLDEMGLMLLVGRHADRDEVEARAKREAVAA